MVNVRRTPSYQEAKEVSNAESNEWLGSDARRDDGQVNSQAVSRRAAPTNFELGDGRRMGEPSPKWVGGIVDAFS